MIRYFPKGHSALRQLLFYLDRQRIITPTYRKLQDMFSEAFAVEEARIKPILQSTPDYWCEQLSALIEHKDGLNQLTLLKADQKDFQYTAVKFEIEKATKPGSSVQILRRISTDIENFQKCHPLLRRYRGAICCLPTSTPRKIPAMAIRVVLYLSPLSANHG
ncbi:hypothetical protein [Vibrio chagasii]|uniref:hypothetical protein n=1 Tax=Vibrio chagasii TaxID=170679 RepID=UPI001C0FFAC3|nr:hypothetical protein [Vibrio chagasii]